MRKMWILIILSCFALAGCGGGSGADDQAVTGISDTSFPTTKDEPSIGVRGTITSIEMLDSEGAIIMVEGKKEEDTLYDRAAVRVTTETEILQAHIGAEMEQVDVNALSQGDQVEISFTGPVKESDPVQADAALILIDDPNQ